MERVTKATLVLVLVVTALLAGVEGGRDVPKTKDEVYNPQTFLGLGWPFLGHWLSGWGGPLGGLCPFLGIHRGGGPGDGDRDHGGDDGDGGYGGHHGGYGGHDGGYGGPGDDKGYGGHAGGYGGPGVGAAVP